MFNILATLKHILNHPLNKGRGRAALSNYFRWQIGSRMAPGAVAVPYVEGTRLLAKPGMTGATGNIYCGLDEYEDMCLVMHALRPGDLFVDIGANIGSYTILAGGVSGANCLAIEPIPDTFEHLMDNIRLNNLESRVSAKNMGLGAAPSNLWFSTDGDSINHVLPEQNGQSRGICVPVETLDTILGSATPTVIKVDVEGYETPVLEGAANCLKSGELLAIVVELNGNGKRYGYDDDALYASIVEMGFTHCSYDPFARKVAPVADKRKRSACSDNVLFVRDLPKLAERVASAPCRSINGRNL